MKILTSTTILTSRRSKKLEAASKQGLFYYYYSYCFGLIIYYSSRSILNYLRINICRLMARRLSLGVVVSGRLGKSQMKSPLAWVAAPNETLLDFVQKQDYHNWWTKKWHGFADQIKRLAPLLCGYTPLVKLTPHLYLLLLGKKWFKLLNSVAFLWR